MSNILFPWLAVAIGLGMTIGAPISILAQISPISPPSPATPAPNSQAAPSEPKPAAPSKHRTIDELLLFHPSKHPDGNWQPLGLKHEDAQFVSADDTKLHGWYCPCEAPRAVLLYAHGNAGNLTHRSAVLRLLQQQFRVTTMIFDYRGYGRSEGVPTASGVLQDARAARTYLARRAGVCEQDIVLMGRSLGGAVVAQLASDPIAPRAVILESTFSSLKDVARHHFPRLAWIVSSKRLNSATSLAKYGGPLLQCHGDADGTIPFELGQRLFAFATGPKAFVRIPGGGHNDPPNREYYQQLDQFLSSLARR